MTTRIIGRRAGLSPDILEAYRKHAKLLVR